MPLVKWKDGGKWGLLDITWGDYQLVEEVAEILEVELGGGGGKTLEKYFQKDKDKKKRFIRLICRVKGEDKAYDETKEVGDIEIKLEDAELVINEVLGKIKVEGKDVL